MSPSPPACLIWHYRLGLIKIFSLKGQTVNILGRGREIESLAKQIKKIEKEIEDVTEEKIKYEKSVEDVIEKSELLDKELQERNLQNCRAESKRYLEEEVS